MNGWDPRPALRHAVVAVLVFATGLLGYGSMAAAWAITSGRHGAPPVALLLVTSVAFTAALPALRHQADRLANWVVFGKRASGYELMVDFVRHITNTMSVDDVLPRLAEAAARSTHRDRGEAGLLFADGEELRQVWPTETAPVEIGTGASVPVRHGGLTVGELGVDGTQLTDVDRQLLGNLAGPAGLALTSVRLTVELRRRLVEVEALAVALSASQQRLIEARRSERQRIRAQAERRVVPHLESLTRDLVLAANHVGDADGHLAAARDDAAAALDALRLLSRSIFSPVLADSGIEAALRAWGDQSSFTLTVAARGDLAALHAQPAIEAALHFACVTVLEELTPPLSVELEVDDRGARASLPWPVGARPAPAVDAVYQLLQDRTDALGGWLRLDEPTGTLAAWLPLGPEPALRSPVGEL